MHTSLTQLAAATALALGLALPQTGAATHDGVFDPGLRRLTFTDNTQPAAVPDVPIGSQIPFAPGTEFRFLTRSGSSAADGHKDIIFGGEYWTFSNKFNFETFDPCQGIPGAGSCPHTRVTGFRNSPLANTEGGPINPGVNTDGQAPLTQGIAGYPVCQAPAGDCPTLFQNSTFLGVSFNFLAPTTSAATIFGIDSQIADARYTLNGVSTPFGPAHIVTFEPSVADGFQIFFPVLYMQFATDPHVFGADPRPNVKGDKINALSAPPPGVLFSGHVDADGNFRLWASHQITRDEATIGAFTGYHLQFELTGVAECIPATASGSPGACPLIPRPVPLPAAAWLLGVGVVSLAGLARRRRRRGT